MRPRNRDAFSPEVSQFRENNFLKKQNDCGYRFLDLEQRLDPLSLWTTRWNSEIVRFLQNPPTFLLFVICTKVPRGAYLCFRSRSWSIFDKSPVKLAHISGGKLQSWSTVLLRPVPDAGKWKRRYVSMFLRRGRCFANFLPNRTGWYGFRK